MYYRSKVYIYKLKENTTLLKMCENDDEVYADNLSNVSDQISDNNDEECFQFVTKRWQPVVFIIICQWQEQIFF